MFLSKILNGLAAIILVTTNNYMDQTVQLGPLIHFSLFREKREKRICI